jgi:hypothetical protein
MGASKHEKQKAMDRGIFNVVQSLAMDESANANFLVRLCCAALTNNSWRSSLAGRWLISKPCSTFHWLVLRIVKRLYST